MPTKLDEMKKRFEKYKDYKDLTPEHTNYVLKILSNASTPKCVRELMADCFRAKMGNRSFYAAMKWVRDHGLIKTKKKEKRKLVCSLAKKGKDALEYLSAPKYDSIEFRVDGARRGKIKVMMKNDEGETVALGAFELELLLGLIAEGYPGVLEGVYYLAQEKKGAYLEIQSELSKEDLDIGELESDLWDIYLFVVERELPKVIAEDFMGKFESFYPDNKEVLKAVFQEYLRREKLRLRLTYPSWPLLHLPASFQALNPEVVRAKKAYMRYWAKRVQAAEKELQETGKITIEKYVPQIVIDEIKKPACVEWIKRRLAEDPNFFMPGFFWSRLGFKVARAEKVDASRPYNTLLDRPKFARIIRNLMWPFQFMADACRMGFIINRQGKINAGGPLLYPTVLIKYPEIVKEKGFDFWKIVKDAFEEFIAMLKAHQTTGDFYEAWRIIGQLEFMIGRNERRLIRNGAGTTKEGENFSLFRGKDLVIFAPIQEALIQYIAAGRKPVVDLVRVYSDLREEKTTLADAEKAIECGEYALKD